MSTNSGTSFFLIRFGEAESIQHDPLFCSVCKTTPPKPLEESLQPGVCLSVWLVPQVLCNLGRAPHTSTCYAKFCRWALSPPASNLSVLTRWFLFSSCIHCIAHLAHCCCFLFVLECVEPNSKVNICVLSALIRIWPASCRHLGGKLKHTTCSC